MTSQNENHALQEWREDVEVRARGGKHEVKRGTKRRNGKAPGTWRCEGVDQCKDQMSIWDCIAEAEKNQQERGEQQ